MKRTFFAGLVLVFSFALSACGAGQKEVRWIKGPMPPEGNFDGVYQSDFGRLELTASGNRVTGLYESDQFWGRLEGMIDKNLLVFNWHQFNEEMQGKIRETHGKGVFQYIVEEMPMGAQTKKYHRLEGWWSYKEDDLINRWNAAKLSERSKKKLVPHDEAAEPGAEGNPARFESGGQAQEPSEPQGNPENSEEPKSESGDSNIF
jgi:hypothetical protein